MASIGELLERSRHNQLDSQPLGWNPPMWAAMGDHNYVGPPGCGAIKPTDAEVAEPQGNADVRCIRLAERIQALVAVSRSRLTMGSLPLRRPG